VDLRYERQIVVNRIALTFQATRAFPDGGQGRSNSGGVPAIAMTAAAR